MMTVYPGAIQIPSPFHSNGYPGFGKPKWIIIHGTASGTAYPAQATGRDFQKSGNSTHFVVGYDGTVVQCVDLSNAAWGNGFITGPAGVAPMGGGNRNAPHDAYWNTAGKNDANMCTVSIEHSKSGDNTSALSTAQMDSSFRLIAWLVQLFGIPPNYGNSSGGITGHYSMDPVNRAYCPGQYPWQSLFSYLGGNPAILFNLPFGNIQLASVQSPQKTYTPLIDEVHDTLTNVPGFYGIALSIDEAEQFPGWIDLTQQTTVDVAGATVTLPDVNGTVRSAGATIADNFLPFAIRSGLVLFGTILLFALVLKPLAGSIETLAPLLV